MGRSFAGSNHLSRLTLFPGRKSSCAALSVPRFRRVWLVSQLVTRVRKSVTIDWTLRESARAKIKVLVKRILRKHGYPPDLQDEAMKLVLQQAEVLCSEWAG